MISGINKSLELHDQIKNLARVDEVDITEGYGLQFPHEIEMPRLIISGKNCYQSCGSNITNIIFSFENITISWIMTYSPWKTTLIIK